MLFTSPPPRRSRSAPPRAYWSDVQPAPDASFRHDQPDAALGRGWVPTGAWTAPSPPELRRRRLAADARRRPRTGGDLSAWNRAGGGGFPLPLLRLAFLSASTSGCLGPARTGPPGQFRAGLSPLRLQLQRPQCSSPSTTCTCPTFAASSLYALSSLRRTNSGFSVRTFAGPSTGRPWSPHGRMTLASELSGGLDHPVEQVSTPREHHVLDAQVAAVPQLRRALAQPGGTNCRPQPPPPFPEAVVAGFARHGLTCAARHAQRVEHLVRRRPPWPAGGHPQDARPPPEAQRHPVAGHDLLPVDRELLLAGGRSPRQ